MKLANIVVMDEQGREVWFGSLHSWLRANCLGLDGARNVVSQMRPFCGRPSVAEVGGGAAPSFFVSVVS